MSKIGSAASEEKSFENVNGQTDVQTDGRTDGQADNRRKVITIAHPEHSSGELLIVLGFNDTSTLVGHFVSSPREREKRNRRDSRGDERDDQGRNRNRNESGETEEIKTFPLYPYLLQG